MDHPLARAIKAAGGVNVLARELNVQPSAIGNWRRRQAIPAERAPEIERITGIPRHELRPDLWPAPADKQAAA